MERRKYQRVAVNYKVTLALSQGGTEGDGSLINLSEKGCAIQTTGPVPAQAFLRLRIHLPDCDTPIEIATAHVRWAQDSEFGVEFLNLQPEVQQHLRHLILIQELQTS